MRFRPIMMTTSAAMLGALPLALSFGDGGELRRPLGISIVGGLMVSQVLTLYTTPVLYLYLDRFRLCCETALASRVPRPGRRRRPRNDDRLAARRAAIALRCSPAAAWSDRTTNVPTRRRPPAFKELAGWKLSQPRDDVDKGAWWSIYHDPELDRLERMVEVSNQTVKQFEAQYRNAVALVGEARAGLFPTVGAERRRHATAAAAVARSSSSSSSSGRRPAAAAVRRPQRHRIQRRRQRDLGPGRVGPHPAPGRKQRRRRAGQRGRSGECANCRRRRRWPPITSICAPRIRWRNCCARPSPPISRALQITENQYRAGTSVEHRLRDRAGAVAIDPGATGRRSACSASSSSMRSPC